MSFRFLVSLAIVMLSACASDQNRKGTIDDIDRRHTEDMQRMGGGDSDGGSMLVSQQAWPGGSSSLISER